MIRCALCSLFVLAPILFQAQNFDSACVQQRHVLRMLQMLHFQPPDFNARTNGEIIDLFIRHADEKNIFFSKGDSESLHQLVEQVKAPDAYCAAIRLTYVLYTYKLRLLDSVASALETRELAFDGTDTINFVFRRQERVYYEDQAELCRRIEKRIKYDVLRCLGRASSLAPHTRPDSMTIARAKARSIRKFRRALEKYDQPGSLLAHLSDCMSDAIARRCDPHSNYLNASGFGNYRNALSSRERSFGFSVSENSAGELQIEELVPGGPAWNSTQLSEKDLVIAIRPGGGESLPAFELDAAELNRILEETTHDMIEVTVVAGDMQQRTVQLHRELINSAQNSVTGFLVKRNGRRMGLISIPSFYLDENAGSRKGCASDVAAEIVRLKQDSIEGLMLDLRFNGGGSMREAIRVAGLFIYEGPIAIYHPKNEVPFILKDANRGTVWDGPLLLLINGASASASEFLAAALQDYDRAIIAGSPSFGKGTAQNLLPADTSEVAPVYNGASNAVMKITGGKFYRLTGGSLQGRGIAPDINIPGVLEHVFEREAQLPFHLPCDSVAKVAPHSPAGVTGRPEVLARSKERQDEGTFAIISHVGDSLRKASHRTERVALGFEDYRIYSRTQKQLSSRAEKLYSSHDPAITVTAAASSLNVMEVDSFFRARHHRSVAALATDIVFHESVRILSDMIDLHEPKK